MGECMLKDTQGTTTNKYNQTNDEQKTQFTFWYIHLTESDMIGSEIPNSLKKKKMQSNLKTAGSTKSTKPTKGAIAINNENKSFTVPGID